jgi:predicted RNA-binding Zn-ribbon protein involved in translation (DUF1610 family)
MEQSKSGAKIVRAMGLVILSLVISPTFINKSSWAYQESAVYTCSMHAEVQSSKPGKCPKCGMKLIARKPRTRNIHLLDAPRDSRERAGQMPEVRNVSHPDQPCCNR